MFTRGHIILALETQLEPGRSYADRSHNYISDIRLQIVITVALYGNQQVRLTTTNVVKRSRYNQPMDVVAAINWLRTRRKACGQMLPIRSLDESAVDGLGFAYVHAT